MQDDRLNMRLTGRDDDLPLASFIACLEGTLSLLKDLDAVISEDSRSNLKWTVTGITMNSPAVICMASQGNPNPALERDIITAFAEGLYSIETSSENIPRFFTQKMLDTVKKVANVLNDGIGRIEYFTDYARPVHLTLQTVANADKMMRGEYHEDASYEGNIEVLSVHDGNKFNLYEDVYGRIECRLDKDSDVFGDLNDLKVKDVFTGRVVVSGVAKFSRIGRPVSMKVDSVRRLRQQKDLPQIRDIHDATIANGMESATYIRSLRDGE